MATFRAGVQGGSKLYRYISAGPQLPPDFVALFVKSFPMGELRSRMPKRSGRLRASLRLVVHPGGVQLRGIFYAPFLPVVEAAFIELARRTVRNLRP